ncbi:class I SAM-dependent methyltransferase [Cohnella lupini]|uniref:Methyltransferase family protein n=1 Tax=Cohnella lupini TaxID=1294267 RepID=A0A3D9I8L4_9BACL|nr:class I SAM-dependent methyltransferase [Cohnella lupini]RED58118.1 hypothetical protein DFP95_109155 [Cohnella lupini]
MQANPYQILSILLIVLALGAALSIVYYSWKNGISPMPTSRRVRRAVADEVNRFSGPGLLVEAGSGWGTLGIHIARYCKGWRLVGLENSAIPLQASKILVWLTYGVSMRGADRTSDSRTTVEFRKGDIYKYSYEDASIVVCYLYPGAMKRFGPILEDRMRTGARVISVCFALPGWEPERVVTCKDLYRTKVYVYAVA